MYAGLPAGPTNGFECIQLDAAGTAGRDSQASVPVQFSVLAALRCTLEDW